MAKFIRCKMNHTLYPVERIVRIEPTDEPDSPYPWVAFVTDEHGKIRRARLMRCQVDELEATYLPAPAGQTVLEVIYEPSDDSLYISEVPVIAWKSSDDGWEPIGAGGQVGNGANTRWFMGGPDGKCIFPEMWGTAESFDKAIEWVKEDVRKSEKRHAERLAVKKD
jgi:hypothetical protein